MGEVIRVTQETVAAGCMSKGEYAALRVGNDLQKATHIGKPAGCQTREKPELCEYPGKFRHQKVMDGSRSHNPMDEHTENKRRGKNSRKNL